ncbi:monovalent cation/H+ antiporter complex subunit F [Blastococcus tunisiensis]|uniref:Multisubunit sodium/proton antiporter, MrpF subunit n=1 Tax=Blastococcus tunisiensis TaxID=1798228 RepID=A0A1I2DT59_9ACTN|nr:monovalent cation/H+ antiporter complex subunit F [Blastococcus sp. DSM 46838]SFE83884.1 multisubunit sodium/proton antiporter, MrpF subunit [Blastococcus sp. DSM 46838]
MTAVLTITAALLFVAAALTLIRLLRGPTTHDRLVALDLLVVVLLGGIIVEAVARDAGAHLILLVVLALLGFLSTVSVLRFGVEEPR